MDLIRGWPLKETSLESRFLDVTKAYIYANVYKGQD